jgi:hypothetical protein
MHLGRFMRSLQRIADEVVYEFYLSSRRSPHANQLRPGNPDLSPLFSFLSLPPYTRMRVIVIFSYGGVGVRWWSAVWCRGGGYKSGEWLYAAYCSTFIYVARLKSAFYTLKMLFMLCGLSMR